MTGFYAMFIAHGKNDNMQYQPTLPLLINPYPEPECMEYGGRNFTHEEIDRLIHRAAVGLQKLGVGPGMTVGMMMPDSPYTVICTFAAIKAGASVEHYSTDMTTLDFARRIHATETDVMITIDIRPIYTKVKRMLIDTQLKLAIVCPIKEVLPWSQRVLYPILHHHETADIPNDQWHVLFSELIDNNNLFTPVISC